MIATCPKPPSDQRPHYFFGVDLGQKRNHTALAVLEKRWIPGTPDQYRWSAAREYYGEYRYEVVRLERLALNTRYSDAVDWLEAEVERIYWPCVKTTLVDATGVGSAVMDQMRRVTALAKGTRLLAVHITGGIHTGYAKGKDEMTVSRTEVMSALRAAVETKAFSVNTKHIQSRDVDTLREELKRISNQTADKPSETDQDDLAFALALAVWWAKPQSALAFQLPWQQIQRRRPAA
jgi:hypothetical protein